MKSDVQQHDDLCRYGYRIANDYKVGWFIKATLWSVVPERFWVGHFISSVEYTMLPFVHRLYDLVSASVCKSASWRPFNNEEATVERQF